MTTPKKSPNYHKNPTMPRNKHKEADEKALENLRRHLKGGEALVCGVSGGPDSVFLLKCLVKLKEELSLKIIVAHVNHTLRGEEAENDAKFAKTLAKNLGLIFECTKVDTIALASTTKSSVEEAGREIRYNFFLKLFEKYDATHVLTAHHGDDNLETILLNFVRGGSLRGLGGMKEKTRKKNGLRLLRPLLNISKKEIAEHLDKQHIESRLDQTNLDPSIPRNFIRINIIPELKKLNPSLQKTVLKNSKNIQEVQQFLKEEAEIWIKEHSPNYDIKSFRTLPTPIQKKILIRIYRKKEGNTKNIEAVHIEEVLNIINKNIGRKHKQLGKYTVEIKKGTFILN
jgi:tRNA(Ile)-lysidine synthase